MYYGPLILIRAGLSIKGLTDNETGLVLNIPLSIVNAIGSCACLLFIDKMGRRYMILRVMPVAFIGWLITSFGMYLAGFSSKTELGGYLAFAGIIVFLFFYSLGMSA